MLIHSSFPGRPFALRHCSTSQKVRFLLRNFNRFTHRITDLTDTQKAWHFLTDHTGGTQTVQYAISLQWRCRLCSS
jgi:hypothetical protein